MFDSRMARNVVLMERQERAEKIYLVCNGEWNQDVLVANAMAAWICVCTHVRVCTRVCARVHTHGGQERMRSGGSTGYLGEPFGVCVCVCFRLPISAVAVLLFMCGLTSHC